MVCSLDIIILFHRLNSTIVELEILAKSGFVSKEEKHNFTCLLSHVVRYQGRITPVSYLPCVFIVIAKESNKLRPFFQSFLMTKNKWKEKRRHNLPCPHGFTR